MRCSPLLIQIKEVNDSLVGGDAHTYAVEYRVCKWVSVHCPYHIHTDTLYRTQPFVFNSSITRGDQLGIGYSACAAVIAVAGNGDIVASTGHVDEAGGRLSWLCTVLY